MDQSVLTPQHWLARTTTLLASLLAAILMLLIWRNIPHIDIAISNTFFTPKPCPTDSPVDKVCGDFLLIYDSFNRGVRRVGHIVPLLIMLIVMTWGLSNIALGYDPKKRSWQAPAVGSLAAFLGPLLIVNLLFKDFKGRARPFQLDIFGRDKDFTLPGTFTDQCASNCSFPSGEAAAATWLLVLVPFLPKRWRTTGFLIISLFIVAVCAGRVAFGRHFTSDVTMGIAITLVTLCLCFWLVARVPDSWHPFLRKKPTNG